MLWATWNHASTPTVTPPRFVKVNVAELALISMSAGSDAFEAFVSFEIAHTSGVVGSECAIHRYDWKDFARDFSDRYL